MPKAYFQTPDSLLDLVTGNEFQSENEPPINIHSVVTAANDPELLDQELIYLPDVDLIKKLPYTTPQSGTLSIIQTESANFNNSVKSLDDEEKLALFSYCLDQIHTFYYSNLPAYAKTPTEIIGRCKRAIEILEKDELINILIDNLNRLRGKIRKILEDQGHRVIQASQSPQDTIHRGICKGWQAVHGLSPLVTKFSPIAGFHRHNVDIPDHPHLVPEKIRYFKSVGSISIAPNFSDIPNLNECNGSLSEKQRLLIISQVAEGLAALHEDGLIHTDVKPDNVLIFSHSSELHARLSDFEGVRFHQTDKRIIRTSPHFGEFEFGIPTAKLKPVPETDTYALGLMLMEIYVPQPLARLFYQRNLKSLISSFESMPEIDFAAFIERNQTNPKFYAAVTSRLSSKIKLTNIQSETFIQLVKGPKLPIHEMIVTVVSKLLDAEKSANILLDPQDLIKTYIELIRELGFKEDLELSPDTLKYLETLFREIYTAIINYYFYSTCKRFPSAKQVIKKIHNNPQSTQLFNEYFKQHLENLLIGDALPSNLHHLVLNMIGFDRSDRPALEEVQKQLNSHLQSS